MKKPDWKFWQHMPEVKLWEAICLSLNIDPNEFVSEFDGLEEAFENNEEAFKRLRLLIANRPNHLHFSPGSLNMGNNYLHGVQLAEFAKWSFSIVDWKDLPPQLIDMAKLANEREQTVLAQKAFWPWGDHETKLLRDLVAAGREWWSTYDPAEPTTAPKNEDVIAWLIGRGVPKRVAQVMAQILRADGLKTGPRR